MASGIRESKRQCVSSRTGSGVRERESAVVVLSRERDVRKLRGPQTCDTQARALERFQHGGEGKEGKESHSSIAGDLEPWLEAELDATTFALYPSDVAHTCEQAGDSGRDEGAGEDQKGGGAEENVVKGTCKIGSAKGASCSAVLQALTECLVQNQLEVVPSRAPSSDDEPAM